MNIEQIQELAKGLNEGIDKIMFKFNALPEEQRKELKPFEDDLRNQIDILRNELNSK